MNIFAQCITDVALCYSSFLDASVINCSSPSSNRFSHSGSFPQLQFNPSSTGSSTYQLGISMSEDDQAKASNDENGVVSLVTGTIVITLKKCFKKTKFFKLLLSCFR